MTDDERTPISDLMREAKKKLEIYANMADNADLRTVKGKEEEEKIHN